MSVILKEEDYRQFMAAGANKPTAYVLSLLRKELDETRKANDTLTDIELYRSQGKAQTLSTILDTFEKAHQFAAPQQASGTPERLGAFF